MRVKTQFAKISIADRARKVKQSRRVRTYGASNLDFDRSDRQNPGPVPRGRQETEEIARGEFVGYISIRNSGQPEI